MKWLQLNELPVKFLFVSIKSKTNSIGSMKRYK